jgi:hypothetical protein
MSFNISRTGTHEVKLPCLCGITCVTQVEVYERSYVEFIEAENARLREALESIEEQAESGYKESHWIAVAKTAQDALERK